MKNKLFSLNKKKNLKSLLNCLKIKNSFMYMTIIYDSLFIQVFLKFSKTNLFFEEYFYTENELKIIIYV